MGKKQFTIRFKDRTVLVDRDKLPHSGGIPNFGTKARRCYIEKYHSELLEDYSEGVKKWEQNWSKIESHLKG